MIEVKDLKKVYGEYEALRGISLSVEKGEVVGFLGPNGAGKTTTMRILAGYIPATSGSAMVANHDVFDESLEVRKRLGYLPENVPLYTEMRVREFLRYRAALKKIPGFERSAHVDKVLSQCWLEDAADRIIGHLSKGFRQRVGLADALLGSPEVLILDEPTVGLDPNQVRETRKLIKSLSESHTVILSTHILHEVEMICNRVVIIHEGRIVADDTQEGLIESMSDARKLFVELKGTDPRPAEKLLEETEGIVRYYIASREEVLKLEIEQEEGYDLREELSVKFSGLGYIVLELRSERYTLEDIFSMLTSEKFVEADADEQEEVTEGEVSGEEAESDAAESDDGPQTDEAAQEGEQSDSDEEKEGDESPARHVADTIQDTAPPGPGESKRKEMLNSFEKLAEKAKEEHELTEKKQEQSDVAPDPGQSTSDEEKGKEGGAE